MGAVGPDLSVSQSSACVRILGIMRILKKKCACIPLFTLGHYAKHIFFAFAHNTAVLCP